MTDNAQITTTVDKLGAGENESSTAFHAAVPIPRTLAEWRNLAFSVHAYYAYAYGNWPEADESLDDDDEIPLWDRYSDWCIEHDGRVEEGSAGEGLILRGFDAAIFLRCPELPRVAPMMLKLYHERAFSITFAFGGPSVNSECPSLFIVGLIAGHAALGAISLHAALDLIIDEWGFDRKAVCAAVKDGLRVDFIDPGDSENLKSFEEWRRGLDMRPFKRDKDTGRRKIAKSI